MVESEFAAEAAALVAAAVAAAVAARAVAMKKFGLAALSDALVGEGLC